MYEFVKNFYVMFGRDDLFCPASEGQAERLSSLFGTNVEKVTEFYREHQPDNMPMLDLYVSLLGIFLWKNSLEMNMKTLRSIWNR